jgi:hypothetical protein
MKGGQGWSSLLESLLVLALSAHAAVVLAASPLPLGAVQRHAASVALVCLSLLACFTEYARPLQPASARYCVIVLLLLVTPFNIVHLQPLYCLMVRVFDRKGSRSGLLVSVMAIPLTLTANLTASVREDSASFSAEFWNLLCLSVACGYAALTNVLTVGSLSPNTAVSTLFLSFAFSFSTSFLSTSGKLIRI